MTSRPCILLVDYRPQNLVRVGKVLESAGYDLRVASDGAEALRVYEELHPDLVLILEAMLPKKHGFQVCQHIKAASGGRVPVIIASAVHRGSRHRLEATREHGCDEYIERPVPDEFFLAAVQRFVPATAPVDPSHASEIEARIERLFDQSPDPTAAASDAAPEPEEPTGGSHAADSTTSSHLSREADEEWERASRAVVLTAPVRPLPSLDAELYHALGSTDDPQSVSRVEPRIEPAENHASPRHPAGPSVSRGTQRAILLLSAGIATVVIVVASFLLLQSAEPVAGTNSPAPPHAGASHPLQPPERAAPTAGTH